MSNELQLLTTREFNGITFNCYQGQDQQNTGDFWATREQIGQVLGYENPNDAIRFIHKRHAKRLDKFSTSFNLNGVEGSRTVTREVIVYNFKGLLEICRYSNQPKANAVIDWLWDVADEIRRTGMYQISDTITRLERKVSAMEEALNKRYSLSVLGETVLAQTGAISFKDGATFLSQHGVPMGQNRLFKYCRDNHLVCSRKGKQWNRPTQKAVDAGLFNLEISGGFGAVTLITPKGMQYLTDALIAKQYPLLALIEGATN